MTHITEPAALQHQTARGLLWRDNDAVRPAPLPELTARSRAEADRESSAAEFGQTIITLVVHTRCGGVVDEMCIGCYCIERQIITPVKKPFGP